MFRQKEFISRPHTGHRWSGAGVSRFIEAVQDRALVSNVEQVIDRV